MSETTTVPDPEDAKLITLARASRARNDAAEGAAVRDAERRTYVATTVDLPSLQLSALRAAVATAVASRPRELQTAVVVGDGDSVAEQDAQALRDVKAATVLIAGPDGAVKETLSL
jgi:hypothetical protein